MSVLIEKKPNKCNNNNTYWKTGFKNTTQI